MRLFSFGVETQDMKAACLVRMDDDKAVYQPKIVYTHMKKPEAILNLLRRLQL